MSDCNKPTALNHAVMVTQNVLTVILMVVLLICEAVIKVQKDQILRQTEQAGQVENVAAAASIRRVQTGSGAAVAAGVRRE